MTEETKKEWNKLKPEIRHKILEQVNQLSSYPFGSSGYWSNLEEYFNIVYLSKND